MIVDLFSRRDFETEIIRHPVISEIIRLDHTWAFRRAIATRHIQRLLQREAYCCTWCNQPTEPPKIRWCSKQCISVSEIYTNDSVAARIAVKRDDFKCVWCGSSDRIEVDHIRPVILGGGLCGPDYLRTLCHGCHSYISKELDHYRHQGRIALA